MNNIKEEVSKDMKNLDRETLREIIKKTGEVAREEAKRHGTYIVYTDKSGKTVREYADGRIEVQEE
ncbi:hypothetical protein [Neobacillus niacini]|uniref:hypothetical protein n=1 Tax=Neobacillus niacini TaxID=86668 RepID=UPI00286094BE|nr:hypothetical protein [Neobacillus niacini]MDR7000079.1 hypothetical protein [Neobacillus niacini]